MRAAASGDCSVSREVVDVALDVGDEVVADKTVEALRIDFLIAPLAEERMVSFGIDKFFEVCVIVALNRVITFEVASYAVDLRAAVLFALLPGTIIAFAPDIGTGVNESVWAAKVTTLESMFMLTPSE